MIFIIPAFLKNILFAIYKSHKLISERIFLITTKELPVIQSIPSEIKEEILGSRIEEEIKASEELSVPEEIEEFVGLSSIIDIELAREKNVDIEVPSSLENQHISLCETLDRILNTGVVIHGDITISVANIDLIYIGLRALLTSVETARHAGINRMTNF
ncbi:MAG: gas vesicle protein [Planctomycetes bacterium]|nr:gas vesicle protein [Planctomycetota bacterium]